MLHVSVYDWFLSKEPLPHGSIVSSSFSPLSFSQKRERKKKESENCHFHPPSILDPLSTTLNERKEEKGEEVNASAITDDDDNKPTLPLSISPPKQPPLFPDIYIRSGRYIAVG